MTFHPGLNRQKVFDTVAWHLLTQGQKCGDENQCRYRDEAGHKCAIGVLIPDDRYTPKMEGTAASILATTDAIDIDYYHEGIRANAPEDRDFLQALQDIHDDYDVSTWTTNLAACALGYGLSTVVLEEFSKTR
jgi:hypothetical protein